MATKGNSILLVFIILSAALAFFYFQESNQNGGSTNDVNVHLANNTALIDPPKITDLKKSHCGDGVCDKYEASDPLVCPKDCKEKQDPKIGPPKPQDSAASKEYLWGPFGVFGPYTWALIEQDSTIRSRNLDAEDYYLSELGVDIVQIGLKEADLFIPRLEDLNIKACYGGSGDKIFGAIRRGIIRENGGHIGDADRDAILEELDRFIDLDVTCFIVIDEPSPRGPNPQELDYSLTGYHEETAVFMRELYPILKDRCPDCLVVGFAIGGAPDSLNTDEGEFLRGALEDGASENFDAFEFKHHRTTEEDYRHLKNKWDFFSDIFSDNGMDLSEIPVFVELIELVDGPCYMDQPKGPTVLRYEYASEADQARNMLKSYVYGIAIGIDALFRTTIVDPPTITDPECTTGKGLIHNPRNFDASSYKRLSYYTYRMMTEKLGGSDWDAHDVVYIEDEQEHVYVYKFKDSRNGSPTYVVWWDYWNEPEKYRKTYALRLDKSGTVRLTEAVPKYPVGAEVNDYDSAFRAEVGEVTDGRLDLVLGQNPIYLEYL